MRAVDKYEYRRGFKFSHVCHLVDSPGDHPGHCRSGPHDPHSGPHDRRAVAGCATWRRSCLQELGREPTTEETARAAGISVEETRRVLNIGRHPVSLDRPVGESEDCSFGEFIEDEGTRKPRDHRPPMAMLRRRSKGCSRRSPIASGRSSACATAWATATPTRWKKSAASSRSRASACGRSKPRPSANCSTRCAASNWKDSWVESPVEMNVASIQPLAERPAAFFIGQHDTIRHHSIRNPTY